MQPLKLHRYDVNFKARNGPPVRYGEFFLALYYLKRSNLIEREDTDADRTDDVVEWDGSEAVS